MAKTKSKVIIHLKSALARITLTPHTLAFFLLSVIHCVAQGLTAAFVYSEDASSFNFLNAVVSSAHVPNNEIAYLSRSGGDLTLRLCTAAPVQGMVKTCETFWSTDPEVNGTANALVARFLTEVQAPRSHSFPIRRGLESDSSLQPMRDENGNVSGVVLTFDQGRQNATLSQSCARTLEYPLRILDNSRREDIALIIAQFWLLGMSTFGILYNSVPHIWAVAFSRFLATAWASYTLWRTTDVQFRYNTLIVGEKTPCHFDILSKYFTTRFALQIPELVLHITAFVSTSWLAWRIVKGYNSATIRRVGPPPGVMRLYRYFLLNSMFLQLSLYYTVTPISLWIDQLRTSEIAVLSMRSPLYYALFIVTIATIIPWMFMGWFAVRRELKHLMALFLFLNLAYIVCWSVMFYSRVYEWTFIEWPFFGVTTLVSFAVLFGAGITGIICWRGFGKGLAHYLHVEQVLLDSDFNADVFTSDTIDSPTSAGAVVSATGPTGPSQRALSVVMKDTNWDFADVSRPAIYTVDVESKGSMESSGSAFLH